jgi:hypothetical protein
MQEMTFMSGVPEADERALTDWVLRIMRDELARRQRDQGRASHGGHRKKSIS